MACITDREVELFSKRNELIDTLSEERGSTPEGERRIAHHERDSKTANFLTVPRRSRIGVNKWVRSGGIRSRQKEQKRGLNSNCQLIRARSLPKPTSPSIPWRAIGY